MIKICRVIQIIFLITVCVSARANDVTPFSNQELWGHINRSVFVDQTNSNAFAGFTKKHVSKFQNGIEAYVESDSSASKSAAIIALKEISRVGNIKLLMGDADKWNLATIFTNNITNTLDVRFRDMFKNIYGDHSFVDKMVDFVKVQKPNCYSHVVTHESRIYYGYLFVSDSLSGDKLSKCLYKHYMIIMGFVGVASPGYSVRSDDPHIVAMTDIDKAALKFIYSTDVNVGDDVGIVKKVFNEKFVNE